MGRGGTKFEGEAIGVRSGRKSGHISMKERRKNMEKFQKTGVHPEVASITNEHIIPQLPIRDPNRPHVFLGLQSGKKDLGRLVIEVFEPEVPLAARQFLTRCNPGAAGTLRNTIVHRLVENLALFAGNNKGHKGVQCRRNGNVRHSQMGAVSLSASGDEIAISFGRSLSLDETHQVVGRVHLGMDILRSLNTTEVDSHDAPLQRITIATCGPTNSNGTYDPLLGIGGKKETAEEAAKRLRNESAAVRDATVAALEEGMAQKRKIDAASAPPAKRKSVVARMLDDTESDDSED